MSMEFDGEISRFNIFDVMRYPYDVQFVYAIEVVDDLVQKVYDIDESDCLENALSKSMYVVQPNDYEFVMSEALINSIFALNSFQVVTHMHKIPLPNAFSRKLSSLVSPPTLKLKPLPNNLKYVYLGDKETLPIIISSSLN